MLPKAIGAVILGLAMIIPASSEDPTSDLNALIESGPAGDEAEQILTFSSEAAGYLVAYAQQMTGQGLRNSGTPAARCLFGAHVGAAPKMPTQSLEGI